jgi:hypothetical protein
MLIGGLCYGVGFTSMAAGVHYHSLGTSETRKNFNFLFDVLKKEKWYFVVIFFTMQP